MLDTMPQDMMDRLIEIGRCYEMEINVQIIKLMAVSRRPSPVSILIHQKQREYVEYFNYVGSVVTHDARYVSEIKSRVIKAKQHSTDVVIADLIACSTCFGYHYAHHQELKSIIQWLCVRFAGCC